MRLESTSRHDELVDLVRSGYGDCQQPPRNVRLLDFHTEAIMDWQELADCVRAIGVYNSFQPDRVLDGLEGCFDELMYVTVGREGSPVLYATVPYWTHQLLGQHSMRGERLDEARRERIAGRFLVGMRDAGADEFTVCGFGPAGRTELVWTGLGDCPVARPDTCRAWWG